MSARVRVIILNYNTAELALKLVKILLRQSYNNFEIVVVDNNSSISDQLLLAARLPDSIIFIQSKTNLGYSAGNNLGMKYSSQMIPDFYLILNSDLEFNDTFLIQKLVSGFDFHSSLPILAQSPLVNTVSINKPVGLQIQVRKLLSPPLLYLLSFSLFKKLFPYFFKSFIYKSQMPFDSKFMICDSINGAAFMIRANFMRSNNYLDENVFLYNEEMILAKQIRNSKGKCILNGFLHINHLQGASTGSSLNMFNVKMERLKYQSDAYFLYKYLQVNIFFIYIFKMLKELELQVKVLLYKK